MNPLGPLAVAAILAAPLLAHAQTYSRCVDATGRLHLADAPPAGVHCVALSTRELSETPVRVATVAAPAPGHALWLTEPAGVMLLRTYPTDGACRAALDEREAAARRSPSEVRYRCLPAGATP
jgi:hypothetical protein